MVAAINKCVRITNNSLLNSPKVNQPKVHLIMKTTPRHLTHAIRVVGLCLLTAAANVYADYQSTILNDAPVGYWRLGEMPETYGDIGVANLGSLGAAANGVFGGGVLREVPGALNGSSDTAFQFAANELSRVTMGSASDFNFTGTTAFTLETWAKPDLLSGSQRLIANGSSGQGYAFCFQGNNTLRITAFGVADVTSDAIAPIFSTNQWYHVAVVRSNTSVYFYVNGTQLGAVKTLNNIITTANSLTLGRTAAGGEPFTGVMDEAAVFATALPAAKIAAHYDAGLNNGAGYANVILADAPLGYWRLNEPKKAQESTTVIANTGSIGAAGNGQVFGGLNSVVGGQAGALTGDANPAMRFNGVDGKIQLPYSADLNPASFTVECWARIDNWAGAHQSPVSSRDTVAGAARGYILYAAPVAGAAGWAFWTGNQGWETLAAPNANVVLGQWSHVVGTYDAASGTKLLYVDGELINGSLNVTVSKNEARPLRIGAGFNEVSFGNYFVNGAVDEVAIYPTALNQQQILAHYVAATGAAPDVTAAPQVLIDPVGQSIWETTPITLSCVVAGSLPMQLQWYHVAADGTTTTAVPGGNDFLLTLNPTTMANEGYYYLSASNALGETQSAWAWVEVKPLAAPNITLDVPATIPVYHGGTAGLDVVAEGTPPLGYLLQSNGVTMAWSEDGHFKVPNVQPGDASTEYRVVVTNSVGSGQTAITKLNVLNAPAATSAAVTTGLNPAGYWRLGDDVDPTAFDYWNGLNGDYASAGLNIIPGALTDDDDGCVNLYGSGSYVRMRDATAFQYTGATNQFTLSAWINADSWPATGVRFFSTRLHVGNTGGYGFGIWNGNSYRFTAFGVTDIAQGLPAIVPGEWYHVVAVNSNATVYFYLNGVFQGMGNANHGGIKPSPSPLQLGGNPNFNAPTDEESFNGRMDEASVFNRALTPTEIKALYDSRYGSQVPPSIVQQPASVRLLAGGTARFSVAATGSLPLSYQWKTNGVAITGATNAALVIPNVTSALSGLSYSVTVGNLAATVDSSPASLTLISPSSYTTAVVADNPAGFWRLNEASGTPVAYDTWGSHNGVFAGSVALETPGALLNDGDTAAAFDGVSPTRVEVPYAPELNAASFSVECWARVTAGSGTYRAAVSARNEVQGANQGGFILYANVNDTWSFWTSTGSGWQALNGTAVTENEWTHLVATYDGTTKRFYINGNQVATAVIEAVPNPLRPLRIGAGQNELDPGNYFFSGDLDEVAVYGYALPAERVADHYNLGKYSTTTPPFVIVEPSSVSVVQAGDTVSLSVIAGGSPSLSYQWQKVGGGNLAGATQSTLTIPNAYFTDTGEYRVQIANGSGTVLSHIAQVTVLPPPSYALQTQDLVLHLTFDDNFADTSGRGFHGVPSLSAPTFVPGRLGQAIQCTTDVGTGIYTFVQVMDPNTSSLPDDLQFGADVNFSISYWVKFTGAPGDLPFLTTGQSSYGAQGLTFAPGYNTGTWSYYLGAVPDTGGDLGTGYNTQAINDNNWHLLVHSFDRAGNAVTYLDGTVADSRSMVGVGDLDAPYGYSLTIGQDITGSYPESATIQLDDIGIWRRALSAYDAQSIYAAAQTGNSFDVKGPVRLYLNQVGDYLDLSWQSGTLLQSSTVNGNYTPVPGAQAPFHRIVPAAGTMFFRVQD